MCCYGHYDRRVKSPIPLAVMVIPTPSDTTLQDTATLKSMEVEVFGTPTDTIDM